jgi:hypothetical protein
MPEMNDVRDALDERIAQALNEPLGTEQPARWDELLTSRRPRRIRLTALLLGRSRRGAGLRVAAVAGALTAAALLLVLPGSSPSLLESASAAVRGDGPVLHLVFEPWPARIEHIDAATGRVTVREVMSTDELWYDRERRVLKRIVDYPGAVADVWWRSPREAFSALYGRQPLSLAASQHGPVSIQVPPAVMLFSRYKEALAAGEVRQAGAGTLDGRPVIFLWFYRCELIPFPGRPGSSLGCGGVVNQTIALDKSSYRPVAVYPRGTSGEPYRIAKLELVSRADANLAKPAPRAARPALVNARADCGRYGCPEVAARRSTTTSRAGAASWLGRAPFGLRPSLAGRELGAVRADLLGPAGMPDRHGLQLVYGPSCDGRPMYGRDYVLVQQARTPEVLYQTGSPLVASWGPDGLPLFRTSNLYETCAAPNLNLFTGSDRPERALWLTTFRRDGMYVSVSSPRRELAIRAALELLRR